MAYKAGGGGEAPDYGGRMQADVKRMFAQLINAQPSEISFVGSTMAGENLIASGLGLGSGGGNVVTDALHFEGSLYLYGALRKQGLEVRIVKPRSDWRIHLEDLDRVIDGKTRLVALSQVSMINGFQHDLKAVCELAHSRKALVFADVIQAAGAVPLDVRASGVDFCACSSYKWLMGDMGVGFLYVREDLLGRVVRRSQYGYRQLTKMDYHLFPYDPPGAEVLEWEAGRDAGGHFEMGTVANAAIACLTDSLRFLNEVGVARIQAYRQPLVDRVQRELPRLGFEPMTPPGSTSPIVTFAHPDTRAVAEKLKRAKVDVAVYPHRIRVSPSVYNDQGDIDRLLEALG
jgi:selenocysteine lyase/cysteine desulfurase